MVATITAAPATAVLPGGDDHGNLDEVFGISPVVKIPPAPRPASITRDDLFKDDWIKQVVIEL